MKRIVALATTIAATLTLVVTISVPAEANHSWRGYHWARKNNPFTVRLGDNVGSAWDAYLNTASSDWTQSSVLDTTVVSGATSSPTCSPVQGRVEVCNGSYGQNGWLGVAQIWLLRGSKHIAQGTVKLNDTYFAMSQYNNASERQHVMCQEIGHTFGLDHQSETGATLGTCMDYYKNTTNDGVSIHPNAHDYDQLAKIYGHLDSSTSVASGASSSASSESVRHSRDSQGREVITFIFWA